MKKRVCVPLCASFTGDIYCIFSVLVFTQLNLDKLYVLAVNHVFKKNLLPLLMDQSKKNQHLGPSKESSSVTQSIFKHALCIQNLELAAATIHKIAQDLPAGESADMTALDPFNTFIYLFLLIKPVLFRFLFYIPRTMKVNVGKWCEAPKMAKK